MGTIKAPHLPPGVQKLIAAAEHVCDSANENERDEAIQDLRKALRNFGKVDSRQVHSKDPRRNEPI